MGGGGLTSSESHLDPRKARNVPLQFAKLQTDDTTNNTQHHRLD